MSILFCFYLLAGAVWDIRSRLLPGLWLWGGFFTGVIYVFLQISGGDRTVWDLILSLFPGVLFYLFARISQSMGVGDAWLILISGLFLHFYELIKLLSVAFFLSAIGSAIIIIAERKMKNLRIAFVPFLFLAAAMI